MYTHLTHTHCLRCVVCHDVNQRRAVVPALHYSVDMFCVVSGGCLEAWTQSTVRALAGTCDSAWYSAA